MGNQKGPSVVAKRRRSERHSIPAENPIDDEVEDQSEDEESVQPARKSQRTDSSVEPNLDIISSSPAPQPKPKPVKKHTAVVAKKMPTKKVPAKGKNKKVASDAEMERENSELELVHFKDNQ